VCVGGNDNNKEHTDEEGDAALVAFSPLEREAIDILPSTVAVDNRSTAECSINWKQLITGRYFTSS
jgi:hypothetical protein